jgi:hypothetical protein
MIRYHLGRKLEIFILLCQQVHVVFNALSESKHDYEANLGWKTDARWDFPVYFLSFDRNRWENIDPLLFSRVYIWQKRVACTVYNMNEYLVKLSNCRGFEVTPRERSNSGLIPNSL